MSLELLQSKFQAAILDEVEGIPPNLIHGNRFSVYQEGYVARLVEVLEEAYEAVVAIIGHERFHALAESYIRKHPSQTTNINHYGREMNLFLKGEPLLKEFPFLSDLARWEWMIIESFHAGALPALTSSDIAALSNWAEVSIVLQPHIHIMKSEWNLLELWNCRTNPEKKDALPELRQPTQLLVYRQGTELRTVSIGSACYDLLAGLKGGLSFGEALSGLEDRASGAEVSSWFSEWMALGFFTSVQSSTSS